ncbi:hypothetical protein ACIGXA_14220 [Streptomyces fildesensis]|uniref:Uncharacterized protein n=1 Tax=Streptomyces fildesensis TaxID=375757 RepID=A0ABW8C8D7_9ACTN
MLIFDAYADAPPVIRETNLLLNLVTALQVASTSERVRELELRKAALLDRISLQTPADTEAADVAGEAAIALLGLDHGPLDVSAAVTRTRLGIRARCYVREQYAAYSDGLPIT